jgi:serine/threonine protein kinase
MIHSWNLFGLTDNGATVCFLCDDGYVDFISKCLEKDPKERPTPSLALKHDFYSKVYPDRILASWISNIQKHKDN